MFFIEEFKVNRDDQIWGHFIEEFEVDRDDQNSSIHILNMMCAYIKGCDTTLLKHYNTMTRCWLVSSLLFVICNKDHYLMTLSGPRL